MDKSAENDCNKEQLHELLYQALENLDWRRRHLPKRSNVR